MRDELSAGLPTLRPISNRTETMPAWVIEGQKVAMVGSNRLGPNPIELVPVKRVTAKFVILDLGHYERKFSLARGLEEAGQRDAWSSSPFLADPDNEVTKLHIQAYDVALLGVQASRAGNAFDRDRSPENAATAEDMLGRYLEAWNNLAHAKAAYNQAQGVSK